MIYQPDLITLQINLSPGDIDYALMTVPALVQQHPDIKKRLLIVDCNRPQKTKIFDPDIKHPNDIFAVKVDKIISIAEKLLADAIITQVYYIKPNDPLIDHLAKKYLRNIYKTTHSGGGTANMSYWAGIELSTTPYVLHYDGDLLLHQEQDYLWTKEAFELMQENEKIVIAVPRLCPPVADDSYDFPSLHEGRKNISHKKYWLNDFFSTRHFLLDKTRFEKYLPLPIGKVLIELLLRKYGKRVFPIDPEMLMFKSIGPRGGKRLVLKNKKAWFTHPLSKPQSYIAALQKIINMVKEGKFPESQAGYENMKLDDWVTFITNDEAYK